MTRYYIEDTDTGFRMGVDSVKHLLKGGGGEWLVAATPSTVIDDPGSHGPVARLYEAVVETYGKLHADARRVR